MFIINKPFRRSTIAVVATSIFVVFLVIVGFWSYFWRRREIQIETAVYDTAAMIRMGDTDADVVRIIEANELPAGKFYSNSYIVHENVKVRRGDYRVVNTRVGDLVYKILVVYDSDGKVDAVYISSGVSYTQGFP